MNVECDILQVFIFGSNNSSLFAWYRKLFLYILFFILGRQSLFLFLVLYLCNFSRLLFFESVVIICIIFLGSCLFFNL